MAKDLFQQFHFHLIPMNSKSFTIPKILFPKIPFPKLHFWLLHFQKFRRAVPLVFMSPLPMNNRLLLTIFFPSDKLIAANVLHQSATNLQSLQYKCCLTYPHTLLQYCLNGYKNKPCLLNSFSLLCDTKYQAAKQTEKNI